MIVEAAEFHNRYQAVDFAARIVRPDLSDDRRLAMALTYAAGDWHAIDHVDAVPNGRIEVRAGRPRAPIFTYMDDGCLVGAVVCSCVSMRYPTRVMMLAVDPGHRGRFIGGLLIERLQEETENVGVAPSTDWQRRYYERCGFSHWYDGAIGPVGFTRRISSADGLRFLVPAAAEHELNENRQRVALT